MCLFVSSTIEWNKDIPEDEAIIAYKWLKFDFKTGCYVSPVQSKQWSKNKRLRGPNRIPLTRGWGRERPRGPGIYAFATARGARASGRYSGCKLVKVKLWGNVIKFKRYEKSYIRDVPAGYMATRAEIVEEV